MTQPQLASRQVQSPPSSASEDVATPGVTAYGCGPDEAALFTELAPRLGVTTTLVEADLTEANVDAAAGCACISIGHKAHISNRTLGALRRAGVSYISTRSVGCNHLDVDHAQSLGITVETVNYSPDSVGDFAVMLMLMAIRGMPSIMRRAAVGDYRLNRVPGRELPDLTVGVVGTGRIGAAVIARLSGFGCRVLAYDARPATPADYRPLDELLKHSDIVTLHTPLTADTYHLLSAERLARMKPGAVVVNTARGALIDTEALVSALESGRLGGAALDVAEGEEGVFYADCRDRAVDGTLLARLQQLPNVVITPHTAYHTDRALRDCVLNSLTGCLAFVSRCRHA